MGHEQNASRDNLIFTLLFKNPYFYQNASPEQVRERLTIFRKYMEGTPLSPLQMSTMIRASLENPTFDRGYRFLSHLMLKGFTPRSKKDRWGWKEPNTHIYLPELLQQFPSLHYIHVIRHGLDMAFSSNKQQLENWGALYGISLHGQENQEELSLKQLDLWIRSTQAILEQQKSFPDRITILNHNRLCTDPYPEIKRLLRSVNISSDPPLEENLAGYPRLPASTGRYQKVGLNLFRKDQLHFVEEMGFPL